MTPGAFAAGERNQPIQRLAYAAFSSSLIAPKIDSELFCDRSGRKHRLQIEKRIGPRLGAFQFVRLPAVGLDLCCDAFGGEFERGDGFVAAFAPGGVDACARHAQLGRARQRQPVEARGVFQQGRVAAATILGEEMVYDEAKDSGVIFTRPEAGFVGLSMEQAQARGIDAAEVKVPMNIDAKAMITGETHGLIKIVADKASHRIIGVHLLADHTDTLIGEAVLMVSGGMTLEQGGEAIHPHPTQTGLFGELARRLLSRLRRSKAKQTT